VASGHGESADQVIRLAIMNIREAGAAGLARIPGSVLRESVSRVIRDVMLGGDVTAGFQNSLPGPVSAVDAAAPDQPCAANHRTSGGGTESCEAEVNGEIARP
jgi:hypothetical protein